MQEHPAGFGRPCLDASPHLLALGIVLLNRIERLQAQRNASGRGAWQVMSQHRDRVTGLLQAEAAALAARGDLADTRLCLLGCGNCNDIDLPKITPLFGQVDLVDIDADAVQRGIQAQFDRVPPHVENLSPVDLTGCTDTMSSLASSTKPASREDVDGLLKRLAENVQLPPRGPYDVVASVCLLSQLVECITIALGETHSSYLTAIQAIRTQHLRLLAHQLRLGGTCLLITDFVSSLTAPGLSQHASEELPAVVEQLIRDNNFFSGLNPTVLLDLLQHDPQLSLMVADVSGSRPWIWDLGKKQFAVVAIRFRRR